jgi:hypothetical protein
MMQKQTLEHCQKLHIRDVRAAIPHRAMRFILQVGHQELGVIGRLTNLKNGYRYFFLCSSCEKPYESLYRKDFGGYECRECLGLVYASCMKVEL